MITVEIVFSRFVIALQVFADVPRSEFGMRKSGAENLDQCRAELPWDEPAVPRDFKFIMNLLASTDGYIVKGGLALLSAEMKRRDLTRTRVVVTNASNVPVYVTASTFQSAFLVIKVCNIPQKCCMSTFVLCSLLTEPHA